LMRYLYNQSSIADDLQTKLTIDVYISHFDREDHIVQMPTSTLLKISEMLKSNESKLRITENDVVEEITKHIGRFSAEEIREAEDKEQLHNFRMNSRFLFTDKTMTICKTSNCPVPPRLSASYSSGSAEPTYVAVYQPESFDNPRRALEGLFRDLDPLSSTSFKEMKDEFEKLMTHYSNATPANYEMTNLLATGVQKIVDLINVEAQPEEVMSFLAESLAKRNEHREYLEQVDKGKFEIEKWEKEYNQQSQRASLELKQCLMRSMDLNLPGKFGMIEREHSVQFKFSSAVKKKFRFGDLNPKEMPEGCSYQPTCTYTLSRLKKDRVVRELKVKAEDSARMEKYCQLIFHIQNEGSVHVTIGMVGPSGSTKGKSIQTMKRHRIDATQLADLRRAGHDDIFPLDPIVFESKALAELITKLALGG